MVAIAVHEFHKENVPSFFHQAKVRYSILVKQRWFRVLAPWLLATAWLVWGIKKQHEAVRLRKVRAQFPRFPISNVSYWCYLDTEGTGRQYWSTTHMPYTVDWVAGCWSWLESHNQTSGQAQVAVGLDRNIYQNFLVRPQSAQWNLDFFQALKIPVMMLRDSPKDRPVYFSRPEGREPWFGNSQSCYSMRERLWESLNVQPSDDKDVHIGLVEQKSKRFILDSTTLTQDLAQKFPNATVSFRIFEEDVSLADQASWFAQQDIVVMAHGAATTNLMFMRPDTQILELFPRNFFTERFQILAAQCGVHHDWYYDGGPNPKQDMMDHFDERRWRRDQNIHITMDQLKSRVEQMLVNLKQYRR
mmetsp:Transcript_131803/g.381188  ORF Transcript_131803/g.381188 Transcript_131803/m.381188 type:complete len:359 (-) Transcript_131803:219-1295(-)